MANLGVWLPALRQRGLAGVRSTRRLLGWVRQRFPKLPPVPGGAGLWFTLLSFGFLAAALANHGRQMLQLSLDLQGWLWLGLAVGFSVFSLVVNGLGLGMVIRWLGLQPRWAPLIRVYLDTNLRKFLPGGIWHLTCRLALLRDPAAPLTRSPARVSWPQALAAVLLDPLLAAAAALALVAVQGWQGGLGLIGVLPLLLLWPRWLRPLLAALERRQARRLAAARCDESAPAQEPPPGDSGGEPPGAPPLPASYPWLPLLVLLVFVLLRFAGFLCCVLAFDLQDSLAWTGWLAGFALAWTAGLVVPGSPGGLGVFEAVLLLRLSAQIPEAPLLAIAISYRVVVTLADLVAAVSARLDQRLDRAQPAPDTPV